MIPGDKNEGIRRDREEGKHTVKCVIKATAVGSVLQELCTECLLQLSF